MAFPPEAVGSAYYPIGSLGPLACAVGASAYAPLMRRTLALFQDFDVFVVAPKANHRLLLQPRAPSAGLFLCGAGLTAFERMGLPDRAGCCIARQVTGYWCSRGTGFSLSGLTSFE
jgi:hypothetical protein